MNKELLKELEEINMKESGATVFDYIKIYESLDHEQVGNNIFLKKAVDKLKQYLYDQAIFGRDEVAQKYLRIKFKGEK